MNKDTQGLRPMSESASGSWSQQGGSSSSTDLASSGYAQVSDGILQYRRNVGILEKISRSIGTTDSDSAVSETQYRVQVDVVKQLGTKIEKQLQTQEIKMNSMPRSESARCRATHIKLARDYRRVETTYKNIQLETKRKRVQHSNTKTHAIHDNSSHNQSQNEQHSNQHIQLQVQLQEDKINEEIMREREEEIRNINKGMHQVNEIYKDLAHIVASQQDQIDTVETHMEDANTNAEAGLEQIEKASAKADSSQCIIS